MKKTSKYQEGELMKPSGMYYMVNDCDTGFFFVSKQFWNQNMCIDDQEFTHQFPEVFDFLPHWTGKKSEGFSEVAEGLFKYYEPSAGKYGEENFEKGLEVLELAGVKEVKWGQKTPIKKEPKEDPWDYSKDTAEDLLKTAKDYLGYSRHPDFGKPILLIKRIQKFLERI